MTKENASAVLNRRPSLSIIQKTSSSNVQIQPLADDSTPLPAWLAQQDAIRHVVRVTDPQTLVTGGSSRRHATPKLLSRTTTVYRIAVDDQPPVERAFKDFTLLRDQLVKRFPGSCPPPLPPAMNTINSTLLAKQPFLRKRVRQLTLFLQAAIDCPFYRTDDALEQFVSSALEYDVSRLGHLSVGRARWTQALADAPRPKDAMAMMQVLRQEMDSARQRAERFKAAVKAEIKSMAALSQAKSDAAVALGDWLATERVLTTPFAGTVSIDVYEGKRDADVALPDAFEPLRVRTADHALYLHSNEEAVEQALLDAIRFDCDTLAAYGGMLDEGMRALQRCSHAQESLAIAEEMSKKAAATSVTATQRLKEARHEHAVTGKDALAFEKGLCSFELARFRQCRVLRALRTNDDMRCLHLDAAFAVQSLWTDHEGGKPMAVTPPKPVAAVAVAPAETTKVLEAAHSVLALVEKSVVVRGGGGGGGFGDSAKALQEAERQRKETLDSKWAVVVSTCVAQGVFAFLFVVHGDILLSIPVWACAGLAAGIAVAVDAVYANNSGFVQR